MSQNEGRHFRTHTIHFLRRDLKEKRNYQSLLARLQTQTNFYCGSLLQIVKYYENQRSKRANSSNPRFLTITNHSHTPPPPTQNQEQQQNERFSQLQAFYPDKLLRAELKNKFRIKEAARSSTVRKQQQKLEFDKLISDLNTKTKEILSRKEKSSYLGRSGQQKEERQANASQTAHNFYHLRALKSLKQTLSMKQESEDLGLNYEITPW